LPFGTVTARNTPFRTPAAVIDGSFVQRPIYRRHSTA
jgi:hypothetical protein